MSLATRVILILTLILPITCGLSAQQTTTTAETSSTSAAVSEGAAATEAPAALSSHEVRNQFDSLIRQRPPELGIILATEPALLSNGGFLGGYPELARFVAAHPEVRTNPGFYLSSFRVPRESRVFDRILEAVEIGSVFLFMAFVLAWLVRTVIEQRRWSRLSRTQTEVHNKILDRFGTSQELLEYVRSPAGTKFLESAPIALQAEQGPVNAPLSRILWSIQLGVVIAVGSMGMLGVSGRLEPEAAAGMFAMGAIAFCVGIGFIASGIVAIFLSRRLGLWQVSGPPATGLREEVR